MKIKFWALIAIISVTGCPSPTGGEHTHQWGTYAPDGLPELSVSWTDWEEVLPSFEENDLYSGSPAQDGQGRRYGTETMAQKYVSTCTDDSTHKDYKTENQVIRAYDKNIPLSEQTENADLLEVLPIPPGQTIINGQLVNKDGTELQWSDWSTWEEGLWSGWGPESAWQNGPNPDLGVTALEKYTTETRTRTLTRTRTKGIDTDTQTKTETETRLGQKASLISLSTSPPWVANIDTVQILQSSSSFTAGGVIGMPNGNAYNAIEYLLTLLSAQAAALQSFFQHSQTLSNGSSFFTPLINGENAIREQVNGTTPSDYLAQVNAQSAVLKQLLPGDSGFTDLFSGYQAGHYLITRDWRTESGVWNSTMLTNYINAYKAVNGGTAPTGDYDNLRSTIITGMGSNYSVNTGLTAIENELATLATAALVTQGWPNTPELDAMVRALIRQLGQDNIEFQAFYDDISHPSINLGAANETYTIAPSTVAISTSSIGPSSVKLADFTPPGPVSPQYLNNFSPWIGKDRKEKEGIRMA